MVWNTTIDKITISGSSNSYGHFYAPNAKEIVVSGGKVTFSGGSNYGGWGASGDNLEVVYWRQIFE